MTLIDSMRAAGRKGVHRLKRVERREVRDLRRWLEDTSNLLLVSVIVFVPLLMGLLTWISNAIDLLPFLLFPPLASGAYTLFTRPESRSATPRRFVGGLTLGAVSGWLALGLTARFWYHVVPSSFTVHPGAAAFGLLLTGALTWAFDLEESQAFSTALLVLVTGSNQFIYVASVFVSSLIVAGVFVLWHHNFYRHRAEFLYGTIRTDDHILVPIHENGPAPDRVVTFAAQLAAAHDAGKIVLLDVVDPTESPAQDDDNEERPDAVRTTGRRLAAVADSLTDRFDVPCESAVVSGTETDARIVLRAAEQTNCDLITVPYAVDYEGSRISPFIRTLFNSQEDIVALRATAGHDEWRRLLVPVRRDGEVAHAMLDFAERLAGAEGSITVCHCIADEERRAEAEAMLANLVGQFDKAVETRVARADLGEYLSENCGQFDLTFIGASTDRTRASRILSPPTYEQLRTFDCDVAIVHRG